MTYFVFLLLFDLSVSLCESIWLENWVPAESTLALRLLNYPPLALAHKNDWFNPLALTERQRTLRIRTFVIKPIKHTNKSSWPNIIQKVLNVRSRESFQSIET